MTAQAFVDDPLQPRLLYRARYLTDPKSTFPVKVGLWKISL
jgi:hypothetical protein